MLGCWDLVLCLRPCLAFCEHWPPACPSCALGEGKQPNMVPTPAPGESAGAPVGVVVHVAHKQQAGAALALGLGRLGHVVDVGQHHHLRRRAAARLPRSAPKRRFVCLLLSPGNSSRGSWR